MFKVYLNEVKEENLVGAGNTLQSCVNEVYDSIYFSKRCYITETFWDVFSDDFGGRDILDDDDFAIAFDSWFAGLSAEQELNYIREFDKEYKYILVEES